MTNLSLLRHVGLMKPLRMNLHSSRLRSLQQLSSCYKLLQALESEYKTDHHWLNHKDSGNRALISSLVSL